ncbi:MAG: hypothetical protein KDA37_13005 [Planctomycetales bacterium]|nr:hypothetical protein [Planctomycetales bacterium]
MRRSQIRTVGLLAFLAALLLQPITAHAVTFQEIARFDVAGSSDVNGGSYIGNNPSAVAWNGRQLYIAGFNSSGGTADTAIVEVTNALSTGLQVATLGPAFGALSTPNLRGYSGLDLGIYANSGLPGLTAAYDDGAADPNGIQLFDASSNLLVWTKNARGGSGVTFDPGFPGGDPAFGEGVAWTTFGSGRRALQDDATGADIWTTSNGMIFTAGASTFNRDMDFDPDTGDIYVRAANDLTKATRTGDNSVSGPSNIVNNAANAPFVNGQNLSFLSNTVVGDLLVYNDRAATGSAPFSAVVKAVDTSGAALPLSFALIGGGSPADGIGYYDFDFDPTTQTLALMDFANRNVHIFQVAPEPSSVGLALLGGIAALARRRELQH